MEYTYLKHYKIWGDNIAINLLSLRDRMGNRWTEKMQAYLMHKAVILGGYAWRERVPAHVPYVVTTFTEI